MRSIRAKALVLLVAVPVPAVIRAQQPPASLESVSRVAATIRDSGAAFGPRLWPGYRPDTIALMYAFPGSGAALYDWPGAPPEGFAPLPGAGSAAWRAASDRGAANSSAFIDSRPVAQMNVSTTDRAALLGLTLHEAFHAFERASIREGLRFGRGENAALVASYPAFDAANEAGMALEGRILAAALRAGSDAEVRRLLREYSAVRASRARALPPQMAEYEDMAELNEGLAEYVQVKDEQLFEGGPEQQAMMRLLDDLTGSTDISFRRRYYVTGAALGLLLDRLVGPGWKTRLVDQNLTLAELAAQVSSAHVEEEAARRAAQRAFDYDALVERAMLQTAALRAQRRHLVDSLMGRPGVLVELNGEALAQRFIGHCGFDPWNTLQVGDGSVLHTRWLRVCGSGGRWEGEFNAPVLQDSDFTTLRAVVGAEDSVRLTVNGSPVPLEGLTRMQDAQGVAIDAPGLTLRVSHADLEREGWLLRIRLPAR